MTLKEKLLKIQMKLSAPKNQYNSFGKYNYRSCEDILEGLKPHLNETKTIVTVTDEIMQVGDRFYIKATATLHDCESDAFISNTAYARESESKTGMDVAQVTGSASSYARKYALNGLFCIDDVKDPDTRDNRDDNQSDAGKTQKTEKSQKGEAPKQAVEQQADPQKVAKTLISEVKVKALLERCKKDGVTPDKICKLYKVKEFSILTERQYYDINQHWEDIKRM